MQRCSALVFLCIGMALSACSRGGSYPAEVAPLEAVSPPHGGPLSDSSGTIYGDADQVMCNLALTDGPVEVPARMCVNGGGTIEGDAFRALLLPAIARPATGAGSGRIEGHANKISHCMRKACVAADCGNAKPRRAAAAIDLVPQPSHSLANSGRWPVPAKWGFV